MSSQANTPRFPIYVTGNTDAKRALIVVQEAFGVNDHIRDVADRFSDEGYFVVAPQFYHREGSPEYGYDDFVPVMKTMMTLNKEGLTNDLTATIDFLNSLGYTTPNIGIVGYCMGGIVTFYAASLGLVGAAASYYGSGIVNGRFGLDPLLELAPNLKCPWIGFFGDLDKGIPVEEVEQLREATSKLSVPTEITRYADAGHGFNSDPRADYNPEAAKDAYAKTLKLFAEKLTDK